jgi:hypothetical protein
MPSRQPTDWVLSCLCLLEIFMLAMVLQPVPVAANHGHLLPYSSVRNNHIWYDDNMDRYHQSLKFADRVWSGEGSIKIRATPKDKDPTLRVITYTSPDGLCGYWNPDPNPDLMRVSRPAVENGVCGENAPDTVLLHEMALKIEDHSLGDYFYIVMYESLVREFGGEVVECPLELHFHDKHDYHEAWG